METISVTCLVVTRARLDLLKKCLSAVVAQSYLIEELIIVENFGQDGTEQFLVDHYALDQIESTSSYTRYQTALEYGAVSSITLFAKKTNDGGAGGFSFGLQQAKADFIWLMDDDSIPETHCLERLVGTYEANKSLYYGKVGYVASHVMWRQNTHRMNIPRFHSQYGFPFLESASFVSIMISRAAVREAGLPVAEFFIYSDDVEYTQRISSLGYVGILCLDSICQHMTKSNSGTDLKSLYQAEPWKLFYGIRNYLYLINREKGRWVWLWVSIKVSLKCLSLAVVLNSYGKVLQVFKAIAVSALFKPRIRAVE